MKRNIIFSALALTIMLFLEAFLTPDDGPSILLKVDNLLNAPKDQDVATTIIIFDKANKQSTRTMNMIQKGADKRLVKFLTPADQKGIALLSLPNDNLTLYLPAFGKTRKIASSVKNTKFSGTDFSYEDMEAKKYSAKWSAKLISTINGLYTLELTPKSGIITDYSKLIMSVRTSDNYPTKIEHYDKSGRLYKVLTASNIVKVGTYTVAKELVMEDKKSGTKTKMIITSVKYDNGFTDDKFTERELMK